jgi:hypothetical protein
MMGLVHPLVPIFVYILMPFFFMFMPAINIMEGMDPEERN